jgi:hypothetical protein
VSVIGAIMGVVEGVTVVVGGAAINAIGELSKNSDSSSDQSSSNNDSSD